MLSRRGFMGTGAIVATRVLTHRESVAGDNDSPIRIGQIGTKHAHASGKLAAIRKYPSVYEVVGVVEPDNGRWKQIEGTAAYRGLKRLAEEQLLEIPRLQAVAVETEVSELMPTARRCADAGLHIHVDKPAGESLDEFRQLLAAASQKQLAVQMGYMLRYNPAFQFMYRAVRKRWLGDIFEVHTVMSKKVGDATRKALAKYPGGTMFELGCHVIDSVVYLLGQPDNVTSFTRRSYPERDELADNQLAVFEYPRATATVRSALMEVDGFQRRQFVVCGHEGTIEIRPLEPPRLRLTLEKPKGEFQAGRHDVDLPKSTGRYDGEFLDLARVIRREKQADFSYEHDLAVHETILRASGVSLNP